MGKTTLTILGIASAAVLLLILASQSQGYEQPHPYTAAAWLTAMLALGVFVVMLTEYSLHGRLSLMCLGASFLAAGIMSVWEALTLQSTVATGEFYSKYIALWKWEWITLALILVYSFLIHGKLRQRRKSTISAMISASVVLWAAVAIFSTSIYPEVSGFLATGNSGMIISLVCAVIFILGCFAYSRPLMSRGNAVLGWMGYGFIFAAFAQFAVIPVTPSPYSILFGFATLMKVLAYLSPLVGMLAEHSRLQVKLRDQSNEVNTLIQAQQAISSAKGPDELFKTMVDLVSQAFPSALVGLFVFDRDKGLLQMEANVGFEAEITRQLVFRPNEGTIGTAFSDKESVLVRDVLRDDDTLARKLEGIKGITSALLVPLLSSDKSLGVLALFFGGRNRFHLQKDEHRRLDALAVQTALAIEWSMTHDRLLDTTKICGDHANEMDTVWEISKAVSSKLDQQDLVDTLSEKLRVLVGATNCSVLVFNQDAAGLKIMGHKALTRHHNISEHVDHCDRLGTMVAQTGEPMIANNIPNSMHCIYREMASGDRGVHHILSVPMSLRGFMGAINVFRQNDEPFGEREKRLLTRLAPMVAAAIRNAELYEREKNIAENLQRSFIPELPSSLPGIEINACYKSPFDDSLIGGDFYDIIELGKGVYGIAIGDVSGHGIDSAIYTAMSRYMIRAYSSDDRDPVEVISRLNTALYKHTPIEKFVTVVYGVFEVKTSTFTYVNAGHELPLLYRIDAGASEHLEITGPAVGAILEAEYKSTSVTLKPGDVLVLYTDGASEVRENGKFLGTEGLQKIVDHHISKGADNTAQEILTSVQEFTGGRLHDDIALLAIKVSVPGSLF